MSTILIIDDVIEFRQAIGELLEFEGFEVLEADNPVDGFAAIAQRSPDLILIDLSFPSFHGVNFIDWVRGSLSYADIPIIVVSGFNDAAHIQEALSAGANEYLIKPFEVTKIIDTINRLLFQGQPGR